jgi:hypothetical protein
MFERGYTPVSFILSILFVQVCFCGAACKHDFSKIDFPDSATKYSSDGGAYMIRIRSAATKSPRGRKTATGRICEEIPVINSATPADR